MGRRDTIPVNLSVFVLVLTLLLSFLPLLECDEEDYYQLLGVPRGATEKDIKKVFRKLAVQYHPDKNSNPEARIKFEKIANAYSVLSNSEKRRHYDQFGESGLNQQGPSFDFDSFFHQGRASGGDGDGYDNFFGDEFFSFDFDHPSNQAGDDYMFSSDDGGGFESAFHPDMFSGFSGIFHQSEGQSCETVTTRNGNTVTTYTRCT